jgi:cholesterol transport system auxiliary component
MRIDRRTMLRLAAVAPIGGLAGCSAVDLLAPPPPQLYTLSPKTTFDRPIPRVDWQLLVETPTAPAAIDTPRVAVSRAPMTVDYYAGVSWVDRVPLMVQTLMVESFENSGRIIAIGREGVSLRADFVLRTELREFQIELPASDSPAAAVVRLTCRLVGMPRRSIDAVRTFDARITAVGTAFPGIVAAFDEALGTVLKRVVEWTLIEGEASRIRNRGR